MFRVSTNVDGAVRGLDLFVESIKDVDGLLKDFSKLKRAEVRALFATQGNGAWAQLEDATVKRKTAALVAGVERSLKKQAVYDLQRAIGRRDRLPANELTVASRRARAERTVQANYERLKHLEYLVNKSEFSFHRFLAGNDLFPTAKIDRRFFRRAGSPVRQFLEAHRDVDGALDIASARVLGKLAASIVTKIRAGLLVIESRVPWAGAHNEGAVVGHHANLKERRFLEWTAQNFADFTNMAVDRGMAAFEAG